MLILLLIVAKNDRKWAAICGVFFFASVGVAYGTYARSEPFADFAFGVALLIGGLAVFSLLGTLLFRVLVPLAGFTPRRCFPRTTCWRSRRAVPSSRSSSSSSRAKSGSLTRLRCSRWQRWAHESARR